MTQITSYMTQTGSFHCIGLLTREVLSDRNHEVCFENGHRLRVSRHNVAYVLVSCELAYSRPTCCADIVG